MNDDLRKKLVDFFLSDSTDYLNRYNLLMGKSFTHLGARSKLLVDLLFSMECSLKALIFLESTDDEKQTYKKIKVHKLTTLFNKLNNTTPIIDVVDFVRNNKLDKISVAARYLLEASILYRENGVLGQKYYDTVADSQWIGEVYDKAQKLQDFVVKERDARFGQMTTLNMSQMNMDLTIENGERIQNINHP